MEPLARSLLPQRSNRYVRAPALALRDGTPWLTAIAWEPEHGLERVLAWALDPVTLEPREPPEDLGPVDVEAELERERTVSDGPWRVTLHRDGPRHRLVVGGPGVEVVAWEAEATAAAPTIAAAPDGGAWIAFHHDLREDDAMRDLPKWIALRHVGAGGVLSMPAAPMTGRDRDATGEEQSFEFPGLVVAADGAVALFGRGSHRFWMQQLSADGWGARVPLGPGDWGCRGRRVSVLAVGDGSVLIARRERAGIVLERRPGPRGGPPALQRASARALVRGARIGGGGRPDVPDPAARWGRRTLFGDVHQHSAHSDGLGTADEPFLRARWLYGDDFCALSDHESFLGKRIGPSEQALIERAALDHDEPGRFATLFAYEYTGRAHPGPGHKVVYAPEPGLPIASRDAYPEGRALLERLRALGAIAVPHHVGWTGADAEAHDPILQPVWELCSCHGCYEHADHPLGQRGELRDQMIDAMLRRGLRFGLIASSDGHGLLFHHGVARKRDAHRTGLAAVQAVACTREAVLQALRERRCYATSGAKILLDLDADGHPMGADIPTAGSVRVRVTAHGTSRIAAIVLRGPAGTLARVEPDAESGTLQAIVRVPWCYARVEQVDGEMAWSSPVFTRVAG
ncbi:MAG: CehA/McbA family metallohydrolase [Myxococcota bacterium]|nr:CehA/McbA family metallohydrolase [Myxococcota bacterium]MDW8362321.1 CehA/McbA family metallohydrolase [Myxococcales bacterium]